MSCNITACAIDQDAACDRIELASETNATCAGTARYCSKVAYRPAIGVPTYAVQCAIASGCLADNRAGRHCYWIVTLVAERDAGAGCCGDDACHRGPIRTWRLR